MKAISVRVRSLIVAFALCSATIAHAQTTPLDRRVALGAFDISLREALDRLSAIARLRFSYSSEALPLDKAVRTTGDTTTVRVLLDQLLFGVGVTPVVTGADQIVLAPTPRPKARAVGLTIAPTELSRIVVTGSTTTSVSRPLPVSLSVIGQQDIDRFGSTSLSTVFDGNVPGLWLWDTNSLAGIARYASIRGASSLGATYPKVYVDGIGVANPLLLTSINPETVDRIEMIRGPQGAALYGSDAISGVINIVTKHEGPDAGPRLRVRATVGGASSDFAQAALTQNHAVTFAGGTPLNSGHASFGFATQGDFYTNTASTRVGGDAGFRKVRSSSILTGTAQFSIAAAGVPVYVDTVQGGGGSVSNSGRISQSAGIDDRSKLNAYTLGLTVKTATGPRITHTLTAGIDGYRLRNFANDFSVLPSGADSALRAARGGADRTTARATSAIRIGGDDRAAGTISLALEHSAMHQQSPAVRVNGPGFRNTEYTTSQWVNDVGVVAQVDAAVQRTMYVTAGVRVERNSGYVERPHTSMLPMIGGSLVSELGGATLKWRAAYGSGVRAPRTAPRETMMGRVVAPVDLEPERQSGIEGGFDVYFGRTASLQFTAFDQTASGLIQQVVVPDSINIPLGEGASPPLTFRYQNVGSITNRGFEAQARVRRGSLSWNLAYSTVSSRVETVAGGYTGELREGDRMLGIPARTLSTSLSWSYGPWMLAVGATRAYDWMEYDRVGLTNAYRSDDRQLYGADLRGYWRTYSGHTRYRASLTRVLNSNVAFQLHGENLAGYQSGEPDNATILPGRTISAGLRLSRF